MVKWLSLMRSTPKNYRDENFIVWDGKSIYWHFTENFVFRGFSQSILLKHVIKIGFYNAFKASWQDLDDSSTDIKPDEVFLQ